MDYLRTKETNQKYKALMSEGGLDSTCQLCQKDSLIAFKHWRVVQNKYPYDQIAAEHHMLIPNRCIASTDLSAEEKEELIAIKHEFGETAKYDYVMEALGPRRSIPRHYHLHLIVLKEY